MFGKRRNRRPVRRRRPTRRRQKQSSWANKYITFMAVIALLVIFVPLNELVENKIKGALEARGFSNVDLHVDSIGFSGVTLKDIKIGDTHPMMLSNVTIGFTLRDIWKGRINKLMLRQLTLDVKLENGKVLFAGMQPAEDEASEESTPFLLPVSKLDLPFESISIEESTLHVYGEGMDVTVPFNMSIDQAPDAKIMFSTPAITGKYKGSRFTTGPAAMEAILNESESSWNGHWDIQELVPTNTIPPLAATGNFEAMQEQVSTTISVTGKEETKASASILVLFEKPEKSILNIASAEFPWSGGTVSLHETNILLHGDAPFNTEIAISHVALDTAMRIVTANRAGGTGTLSGTLPITVYRNGNIVFHKGEVKAEGDGEIIMAPEAIPGSDNDQIEVLRKILSNFHYTDFNLGVESAEGKKLSLALTVEGNNPDQYEGKPVKLNVHLTGDLLDLLQQNMASVSNPNQYLKQEEP